MKGFSLNNLQYVKRWYLFYCSAKLKSGTACSTIARRPIAQFYIKAVDEQLRRDGDNPTIGILLCKEKDRVIAEYALSDIHKPMGVSEYELSQSLPDELKSSLPTIEQIEAEFGKKGDGNGK